MKRKYCLSVLLLLAWVALNAKVQLPSLVSNNMVLQQYTDWNFYLADSVRVGWRSRQVVVSSIKVSHPVAVRYCFRDFQIGNMGGMNGLPMVPFRTDDW